MSEGIMYLFPDTNVFIQCKPLEQLDWSEWQDFSEIHLIVSRPVQSEIDDQKNRGNSRVARKARTTYKLFRKIIEGHQEYELIRDARPVVKLYLEGPSRLSSELEDTLDYSKSDDQIVGYLHKFRHDNHSADARLLTYDGGPMMTANSLGIPFVAVKTDWLLPPENNELERENARLKATIAQLEKTEPIFRMELVDNEGEGLERLELEHLEYDPLPNDVIQSLLDRLTTRFPKATDFGSREPAPRDRSPALVDIFVPRKAYIPAKDEEIDQYANRDYPKWVNECREVLSDFHKKLQYKVGEPEFTFEIANVGNRPGNCALVNIIPTENLEIYVEEYIPECEKLPSMEPILPPPPTPPCGRWSSFQNELMRSITLPRFLQTPLIPDTIPTRVDPSASDPNAFYYKPNRPTTPGNIITLECKQWRHSTGAVQFFGLISIDPTAKEIRGALTCEVHAENLSKPVKKLIPVSITVKRVDSEERAKTMVEELDFSP